MNTNQGCYSGINRINKSFCPFKMPHTAVLLSQGGLDCVLENLCALIRNSNSIVHVTIL